MNTLDERKAKQLVKQWSQQAERRFANAEQEADARNKQFIEHGAVIYANCAAALNEIITAKDHPDSLESHPGTIQATERQIQRYVARFEAIQSRFLARRSCSEVCTNTNNPSASYERTTVLKESGLTLETIICHTVSDYLYALNNPAFASHQGGAGTVFEELTKLSKEWEAAITGHDDS